MVVILIDVMIIYVSKKSLLFLYTAVSSVGIKF